MEYPFKDLLPREEVTARQGYYRDWTHIDANTFHQISELAKFIREKGYGADTREAIAQALERVYHDATMSGNANMEVSMARAGFNTLGERLDDTTANFNRKIGELGATATFKGSATNAVILAKTGMEIGDEWFDTTNQQSLRWNGTAWVAVGGAIRLGDRSVTSQKIDSKAVTPAQLSFHTNKASSLSTNLFNKETVVIGEYVRWKYGDYGNNAYYSRSEMIPVVPGEEITIAIAEQISFKDNMYNYVSGLEFDMTTQTITVPAGVSYMEINTLIESLDKQQINKGATLLAYESYYPKVANDDIADHTVSPNKTTFFDIPAINLFEGADISVGEYVRWVDGSIGQNADTLFFKTRIKPQTKYNRSHLGQIAYFDSLGNYIGGVEDLDNNVDYQVTTPPDARIAYINVNIADENQYYFKELSNFTKIALKSEFLPEDANTKQISDIASQLILSDRTLNVKIIGDSITAGVGGTGYATDGEIIYGAYRVNTSGHCWANSLKEYYESKFNVSVKNFGVSGRNSWDLLTNLGQIIHAEDDIIICMIGTNDRNNESRDGVLNSKQTLYNNLKAIREYVKSRGKEIIFMSNIPASVDNENLDKVFHMEDVDMVINKLASDYRFEYVSLYKLFIDYCKNNGVTIDSLLNDGLHPNDTGYDVMFYLVTNALGIGVKRDGANW